MMTRLDFRKKRCRHDRVKSINDGQRDTMEFWENVTWKTSYSVLFIDIQDIFISSTFRVD